MPARPLDPKHVLGFPLEVEWFVDRGEQYEVTDPLCVNVINCGEHVEGHKEGDTELYSVSCRQHEQISHLSEESPRHLHERDHKGHRRLFELLRVRVQIEKHVQALLHILDQLQVKQNRADDAAEEHLDVRCVDYEVLWVVSH